MAQQKKITVKPFVNEALKPSFEKGTREKLYPLYFRVTYDRKSTKFKAGDNQISVSKAQTFDSDPIIDRSKEFVQQIVRYELKRSPNFEVKEIGQRIRSYLTLVLDLIWQDLNDELFYALCEKLPGSQVNAWQLISNQTEKMNTGVQYLGSNLSDRGRLLLYLVNLFDTFPSEGITIFEWLVLEKSRDFVPEISKYLSNMSGEFLVPDVHRISEKLNSPHRLLEEIRKYLYERIDLGIAYPMDWETGDYTVKGRVFERLF